VRVEPEGALPDARQPGGERVAAGERRRGPHPDEAERLVTALILMTERNFYDFMNPELRGRARGDYYEHEAVLAAAIAADRGEIADALAPRLVAATVVSGVREVYASYEAQPAAARTPSPDDLLELIDRVIAFARTGVRALDTERPG
jgi:hypothetical protein